jgi:hypothetical protein
MDDTLKPNVAQYRAAMSKILADKDLRIFLWSLVVQDCRVFQPEFPMNASAYCLLAKQEIGKRLLADAKAVNPTALILAEAEYSELQEQTARFVQEQNTNEGEF